MGAVEVSRTFVTMNTIVFFEAKLDRTKLAEAIVHAKRYYPYMRHTVVISGTTFAYHEQESKEIDNAFIEFHDLDSQSDFDGWHVRFNLFGSKYRDISKSLVYFELHSYEDHHQFYMSMNHSGT